MSQISCWRGRWHDRGRSLSGLRWEPAVEDSVANCLPRAPQIALLGGVAGTGLAYLAVAVLKQSLSTFLPRSSEIGVDGVVLLFALVVSLVTGLLFGIAPLHQALKSGVGASLKEGGRGTTAGRPNLRRVLVVTEVAMATMLVIGAALLIQSFARLQKTELGFQPDHVLTARISLPGAKYPPAGQVAFSNGCSNS